MFDPRVLSRSALWWDAAYCVLAGALIVVFAAPLGDHVGLPAWLVALGGFGVLAWAGILWGMARGDEWWGPTAMVAGVNLFIFVLLVVWAFGTNGPAGAVLGLAAAQVLAFAALQAASIIKGWPNRFS